MNLHNAYVISTRHGYHINGYIFELLPPCLELRFIFACNHCNTPMLRCSNSVDKNVTIVNCCHVYFIILTTYMQADLKCYRSPEDERNYMSPALSSATCSTCRSYCMPRTMPTLMDTMLRLYSRQPPPVQKPLRRGCHDKT